MLINYDDILVLTCHKALSIFIKDNDTNQYSVMYPIEFATYNS